jgi:methionine synthase I (cobalamin-dependent)
MAGSNARGLKPRMQIFRGRRVPTPLRAPTAVERVRRWWNAAGADVIETNLLIPTRWSR